MTTRGPCLIGSPAAPGKSREGPGHPTSLDRRSGWRRPWVRSGAPSRARSTGERAARSPAMRPAAGKAVIGPGAWRSRRRTDGLDEAKSAAGSRSLWGGSPSPPRGVLLRWGGRRQGAGGNRRGLIRPFASDLVSQKPCSPVTTMPVILVRGSAGPGRPSDGCTAVRGTAAARCETIHGPSTGHLPELRPQVRGLRTPPRRATRCGPSARDPDFCSPRSSRHAPR